MNKCHIDENPSGGYGHSSDPSHLSTRGRSGQMIVILTALQLEYLAVHRYLTGRQVHEHTAGTLFEKGVIAGRRVAMANIGEGNVSAAALTERAINEFEPEAVLFVGTAGALRDWLRLGDVVVATRVYGYHGGRSTDHG